MLIAHLKGLFNIIKARQSQGQYSINHICYPATIIPTVGLDYECKEVENEDYIEFTKADPQKLVIIKQEEVEEESIIDRRKDVPKEAEEKPKSPPKPVDPVSWFGIMGVTSMKSAQKNFTQGLDVILKLANLAQLMNLTANRIETIKSTCK